MDEESKEVFSNLVTLTKKLEVDLQEDNYTEALVLQHKEFTNEDLMELETQVRMKRDRKKKKSLKN